MTNQNSFRNHPYNKEHEETEQQEPPESVTEYDKPPKEEKYLLYDQPQHRYHEYQYQKHEEYL